MNKIKAEMSMMHQAKDPATRQKHMDEHMKLMKDVMKEMQASTQGEGHAHMKPEDKMQMLEHRIHMLEMMVEQSLERGSMPHSKH